MPSPRSPIELPEDAVCLKCGYSLHNLLKPRCPECGWSFDPVNLDSYGPRVVPGRSPPDNAECLIAAGIAVYVLYAVSAIPHGNSPQFPLDTCMLGLLALFVFYTYAVRVLTALVMMNSRTTRPYGARRPWRWAVPPICGLLVLSAMMSPWPLYVRFWLSRSSFETAVQQYKTGTYRNGGWVGLYYVQSAYRSGSEYMFTTGDRFFGEVGFVYCPAATVQFRARNIEVSPNWFTFYDDES